MAAFTASLAALVTVENASFGSPLVFTPSVSSPMASAYSITGVLEQGMEFEQSSQNHHAEAKNLLLSAFTVAPLRGDRIAFGGHNYVVSEVGNPDMAGTIILYLRRVAT